MDPEGIVEQQVRAARWAVPKAGDQWSRLLTRLDQPGGLQLAIKCLGHVWNQEGVALIDLGIHPLRAPEAQVEALPNEPKANKVKKMAALLSLGHWIAVNHAARIAFPEARSVVDVPEAVKKADALAELQEIADLNVSFEDGLKWDRIPNNLRQVLEDGRTWCRRVLERFPPKDIQDLRVRVRKAIEYLADGPYQDWMVRLLHCGIEELEFFAATALAGESLNHAVRYPSRDWPENLDAELPGAIFVASKKVKETDRKKILRAAEEIVAPHKKPPRASGTRRRTWGAAEEIVAPHKKPPKVALKARRALEDKARLREQEDAAASREEELDELRAMARVRLGLLSKEEREVFESLCAGDSTDQIAKRMGCNPDLIRQRKHRLSLKLRSI